MGAVQLPRRQRRRGALEAATVAGAAAIDRAAAPVGRFTLTLAGPELPALCRGRVLNRLVEPGGVPGGGGRVSRRLDLENV